MPTFLPFLSTHPLPPKKVLYQPDQKLNCKEVVLLSVSQFLTPCLDQHEKSRGVYLISILQCSLHSHFFKCRRIQWTIGCFQEVKMRQDTWFPIFNYCLKKDPAFREHKGSEVFLSCLPGVNKHFCQNQDPSAGGPVQACSKRKQTPNPTPEDSHSK